MAFFILFKSVLLLSTTNYLKFLAVILNLHHVINCLIFFPFYDKSNGTYRENLGADHVELDLYPYSPRDVNRKVIEIGKESSTILIQ